MSETDPPDHAGGDAAPEGAPPAPEAEAEEAALAPADAPAPDGSGDDDLPTPQPAEPSASLFDDEIADQDITRPGVPVPPELLERLAASEEEPAAAAEDSETTPTGEYNVEQIPAADPFSDPDRGFDFADENTPTDFFNPHRDPGIVSIAPAPAAEPEQETNPAQRLPAILESLLFASDRPLSVRDLTDLLGEPDSLRIEAALAALTDVYRARGIQLHNVAGGWQFRTDAANAAWVSRLLQHKPIRLTRAQLEGLAIVAYRQPITRPEIDEIRGVDSGGTLKTLLDRSLIRILGKKEEPGRPMLYGTTKEFLEFFNLRDLKDLPTLREFHELSGEHQAEVAALEGVAPPGSVEGGPGIPEAGAPLAASPSLTPEPVSDAALAEDAMRDDLAGVDELIQSASQTAQAAERRIAAETAPPEASDPSSAPSSRRGEGGNKEGKPIEERPVGGKPFGGGDAPA